MNSKYLCFAMLLATAGCGTPTTPTDAGPESSTDVATSGDALLTNDVTTTADAAADVIAPTDVPVAIDARQDAAASDSQAPTDVPVASDVAQACALTTGAIWEDSGGHVAVHYSSEISVPRGYTRSRMGSGATTMCSPMLPACGAAGITVAQLSAALSHSDVVAALAETPAPLFGRDSRPVDGSVFIFTRADTRSFTVGDDCGGASGCRSIPAGVAALVTVLRDLDTQQVALPECASVR